MKLRDVQPVFPMFVCRSSVDRLTTRSARLLACSPLGKILRQQHHAEEPPMNERRANPFRKEATNESNFFRGDTAASLMGSYNPLFT